MSEAFIPKLVPSPEETPKESSDYFDVEMKMNGVVELEKGRPYSKSIDFAAFESLMSFSDLKRVRNLAMACAYYLSLSVVTDTITEHQQRREWRAAMINAYGQRAAMLEHNRLRVNKLSFLARRALVLRDALKVLPQDSEVLEGLASATLRLLQPLEPLETLVERYKLLPLEGKQGEQDKMGIVRQVSEAAEAFLRFVEHPAQNLPEAA